MRGESELTSIGLVDDVGLMRAMLAELIDARPTMSAVPVSGIAEALDVFKPGTIDVLVTEARLIDGNGIALGVTLQRADPNLIVALLTSSNVLDVVLSLQGNVSRPWSFLSKRSAMTNEELVGVIEAIAAGDVILDPLIAESDIAEAQAALAEPLGITPAQAQVLSLVAQGFSSPTVAQLLGLSRRSVENHLQSIYAALKLSSFDLSPRVAAVLHYLNHVESR